MNFKLYGLVTKFYLVMLTLQALLDVVDVTPSRAWLVVTPKQSLGARHGVTASAHSVLFGLSGRWSVLVCVQRGAHRYLHKSSLRPKSIYALPELKKLF